MARDGQGVFVLPAGNPVVSGSVISSTVHNTTLTEIATALTGSVATDGQSTMTGDLKMGTKKITGLGNGSAATDAAPLGQIQGGAFQWLTGVAGVNTITATATPAITSYSAGQSFQFVAIGTNTAAVTININGLGAKTINKSDSVDLPASSILINELVSITYNGTNFLLGASGSAALSDNSIPHSKLVNISQNYFLARSSAGLGSVEAITGTTVRSILTVALNNMSGTVAPTPTNDSSPTGYGRGSLWINQTDDTAYICLDATDGAAVWREITNNSGGFSLNDVQNAAYQWMTMSGSSANEVKGTLTPSATAYAAGQVVRFIAQFTNNGNCSIYTGGANGVNGVPLRLASGVDISSGGIVAGTLYTAVCTGTEFRLTGV